MNELRKAPAPGLQLVRDSRDFVQGINVPSYYLRGNLVRSVTLKIPGAYCNASASFSSGVSTADLMSQLHSSSVDFEASRNEWLNHNGWGAGVSQRYGYTLDATIGYTTYYYSTSALIIGQPVTTTYWVRSYVGSRMKQWLCRPLLGHHLRVHVSGLSNFPSCVELCFLTSSDEWMPTSPTFQQLLDSSYRLTSNSPLSYIDFPVSSGRYYIVGALVPRSYPTEIELPYDHGTGTVSHDGLGHNHPGTNTFPYNATVTLTFEVI